MKINWTQNPLSAIVLLDDADRWALREALEVEQDPDVSNAWINNLHTEYEAALRDVHVGDCTCQPCSCLKCHAEACLGIDTTPGLTRHMAHKIAGAFDRKPEPTLEEAIIDLAGDGRLNLWNACLPQWRKDVRLAHAWLVKYRNEHFP
jgi:hypothetical protein